MGPTSSSTCRPHAGSRPPAHTYWTPTPDREQTPRFRGFTSDMRDAAVLVVDDDEFIRDLVSSALRIAGFATSTAIGGREALDLISRDRPDLIVLDVGLPGVDGFEVCRRLRGEGDQTPVIF